MKCKEPGTWEKYFLGKNALLRSQGKPEDPTTVTNHTWLILFWFKAMFWISVATVVTTLIACVGMKNKFIGKIGGCLTCLVNTTAFVFLILGSVWIFSPGGKICAGKWLVPKGTVKNGPCDDCGPLFWMSDSKKDAAIGGFYEISSYAMAVLIIIQYVLILCCCCLGCCFGVGKK